MRCTNCGWENSGDRMNCEKCNSPLSGGNNNRREHAMTNVYARKTVNENIGSNVGMPTVYEAGKQDMCPECGYPFLSDTEECPNCGHGKNDNNLLACPKCNHTNQEEAIYCSHCGFELRKKTVQRRVNERKTITPWDIRQPAASCILTLIPNNSENIQPRTLSFSGEEIVLNRANTEIDNRTITSKEQAALVYENNKWYIEDRSEQQTTFIHVSNRVELKSGDIILLGDRRFEFGE